MKRFASLSAHVRLRTVMAAGSLVILAACASSPPAPTEAMRAAEIAVANAEQARVGEFAALELSEAREKLAGANSAMAQQDMIAAERLANEARVSAELASAKTDAAKAKRSNEELLQSTDVLRQEMQRQELQDMRNEGARP